MSDDKSPKADPEDDDQTLRPEGLRALHAERAENKDLKKQLKDLQDKWDTAEAEKLSKEEAAVKRAEKAERERDELKASRERDDLVGKISEETGIPKRLLTGSDEKELRESAKEAQAFAEGFRGPRRPAPDPTQGRNNPSNGKSGDDDDAEALAVLGFGEE